MQWKGRVPLRATAMSDCSRHANTGESLTDRRPEGTWPMSYLECSIRLDISVGARQGKLSYLPHINTEPLVIRPILVPVRWSTLHCRDRITGSTRIHDNKHRMAPRDHRPLGVNVSHRDARDWIDYLTPLSAVERR